MQACTHPPKILLLRISRFREAEDGSMLKLHTRLPSLVRFTYLATGR